METGLLRLVNNMTFDADVYLEKDDYQKINFRIYAENIVDDILKKFNFIDVGNVYDFPQSLPQPENLNMMDLKGDFSMFQRIAVSEKINSIAFYTIASYYIECTFLVDVKHLKKFSKKIRPILQGDSKSNMFGEVDFTCKNRQFLSVTDVNADTMTPVEVVKQKVAKESLVFEEESTIYEVMQDISTFFKAETKSLYEKMQIAYKRGIILYGDPGNGKSAMIREIIRKVPEVTKIVINPNVNNLTRILSSLILALEGKQAIIIIEDIDSLINHRNRSEFLNILDGVEVKSGIYFIGTTNYPEQIDPAFMNRSGRFDRTYKIDNPSPATRRAYFESRDIAELLGEYKVFKDDSKPDSAEGIVELFVQFTDDLPMASLKEVMTSTQYLLASNDDLTVEAAIEKTHSALTMTKKDHMEAHSSFKQRSLDDRHNMVRGISEY